MEKRILGKSGISASVIGLGCWQLGGDFGSTGVTNTDEILAAADKAGISFWDTADVYGGGTSESSIGKWATANKHSRKIATKLGRDGALYPDNYTYDSMMKSIEDSLVRLQVDSLDLIQLHCVPPEVLQADSIWTLLEGFRSQGLIKHYGASVENIKEGLMCLDKPGLTSLQIIFNIFRQDAVEKLLPKAAAADVGIIVRLPLASGLLSGKFSTSTAFEEQDHRNYNKDGAFFNVGETFSGLPYDNALELVDALKAFVPEGMPMAQFALKWIIDHPQVTTVIAGASNAKQVEQNALAASLPALPSNLHDELTAFYFNKVKSQIRGSI